MDDAQRTPAATRIPFWRRIGWTLIASAVLVTIIPVLAVGGFILYQTSQTTLSQTLNQLESVATLKENELNHWVATGRLTLDTFLSNAAIFDVITSFGQLDTLDPTVQTNISRLLRNGVEVDNAFAPFSELFIYSTAGQIVASSDARQIGKVVTLQPYYEAGLQGEYIQTPYYEVGTGDLTMLLVRPLATRSGRSVGALAARLDLNTLAEMMTVHAGLGETGETYLVSHDTNYLLTPSRFTDLDQRRAYHSEGIDLALGGQNGSGIYEDYRGASVAGVYRWLPAFDAALLAEMDTSEALGPFQQVAGISIAVALGAAFIAAVVALYNAARVSRPINALTQVAARIASGDFSQRASIRERNEIGLLADTFNSMTGQLQESIAGLESRVSARTRDLETASEIASAANQVREMDDLFSLTVNLIRDRFNFYYVQVYLIDDSGQWAVLKDGTGYVGRKLLARGHRLPVEGNSIVAEVVRTQKPYVVQDTAQDARFLPNDLLPETRAEIAIPLIAKDRLIGILDIQHSEPEAFDAGGQQLFQTLADQLAVTFENVNLFESIQKRAVELETVAHVSAEAASTLDTSKLLNDVADLTKKSFGLYHAHIYLLDDAGENLVLAAGAGEVGREMVAKGHSIPLDREHSLVARAARTRQGVISNDVTQEPDFMPNPLLPETRSEMAIPIIVSDTLIGVLDVQSKHLNRFTDDDVRVKSTLAGQIAIAIQNARSYERTQLVSEQLSDALRTARLGYWEFDFATMNFVLTDEMYRILGTSIEAEGSYIMPADVYAQRFVHPDSQHVVAEEIMKALASDDPDYTVELVLHSIRANGEEAHDLVKFRVERDAAGTVLRGIGATQDVTERVRAEQAVRENEARFRSLVSNVPGVIYRCALDANWTMHFISPDIATLSGYPEADFINNQVRTYASIIHPDDTALVDKVIQDNVAQHIPYEIEYRIVRADGEIRWVSERGQAVFSDDGTPLWLDGAVVDITEQMQAHEAIIRQNAILENSRDFISMTDPQGNIVYINPGGMQMIGVAAEDVSTLRVPDVHTPEDAQRVAELGIPVALKTGQWRGENRLLTRDGRAIPVDQTIFPVTNDKGDLLFIATIMTDITERKQSETERERLLAEVDHNARFMRGVVDATPDWIFVKDRNFRYMMVNEGYATAIANTPEAMLGKDDLELGFPEELVLGNPDKGIVGFRNDDRTVLAGEEVYNPYDPVIFADGSQHIMATQKVPLRDASGEVYGVLAFARDVTDMYTAQKETETLYQVSALINEARDEQAIIDAVVQHIVGPEVSAVTLSVFDTGEEKTASAVKLAAEWRRDGESLRGLVIPMETFASNPQAALDTVTHYSDVASEPLLDETARQFFLAMNTRALLSVPLEIGERVIGAFTIACDQPRTFSDSEQRTFAAIAGQMAVAVERMTFARQMQKRAVELETVARVSAAATTVLAVQDLLDAVTELTKTSFGLYHAHVYLLDEAGQNLVLAAGAGEAGREMVSKGHSIPLDREHSLVARAARTRQGVIVNDVTQEPDFLPNPLLPDTKSEMAIPMVVGGSLIGVLDVQSEQINRFTDEDVRIKTTLASQVAVAVRNAMAFERERGIADRLREIDRLKSEFIANMSHELRTPLNSIIGYSEVLLDGVDGDLTDDALEDVRAIHSSGQHLLTIINDILDLAKIEAGQMRIDPQPVDLGAFVKDIVHAGQILVKNKPVELRIEAEADLPLVQADPVRLRQIVWNIMSNAVKFTEEGSVTIQLGRSAESPDHALVRVVDTGIGIKKELLPVVFERFRQVDGSSTRRAGGTGLGMAITRHLVQLHGGDIYVESEEGQGSTFWLTLPLHVEEPVEG